MRGACRYCLFQVLAVSLLATASAMAAESQAWQRTGHSAFEEAASGSASNSQLRLFEGSLESPARRAGHTAAPPVEGLVVDRAQFQQSISQDEFTLQFAPAGLLYKSYLAGEKEPRISTAWLVPKKGNVIAESSLGGRVGLLRYGNSNPLRPEGWQFDLEGGAMARIEPTSESAPLIAADFRIGLLSTWRSGNTAYKAGYYHLSSHAGDEYLIENPTFKRLNYVRDALVVGVTQFLDDDNDWSVYGEFAYAFNAEDGAKPIELQYGVQYAPMVVGWPGTPYVAVNGHTREDFGYITSVNVMAGWLFRGLGSNRTLRIGMQYYDGPSMQWEFAGQNESLLGGGIWFDY